MVHVSVSTPKGDIYSSDATFFLGSSSEGEFAILEGHIPLVSVVDKGYVKIRNASGEESFIAIVGGIIEHSNNFITVIAQEAAVAETYEEAKDELDRIHKLAVEENKRMKKDFAVSERELQKSIKKAKAGEFV